MARDWENATYHLGYENTGEQPAVSVHTHPDILDALVYQTNTLRRTEEYLRLKSPFSLDKSSFGFEGVGRVVDSNLVLGWSAVELTVPKTVQGLEDDGVTPEYISHHSSREGILPVVSTIAALIRKPDTVSHELRDTKTPQLVEISLSNTPDANVMYSARFRAVLQPYMYIWLEYLNNNGKEDTAELAQDRVELAEARVMDAMMDVCDRANLTRRISAVRAHLSDPARVSFDYPGDGTGFSSNDRLDLPYRDGQVINAANNDYPWQQLMLIAGLGTMTRLALKGE